MIHYWIRRDQLEALIRQLFRICQSGLVVNYVEWFSVLVDELATYDSSETPLYFAMIFLDGFREDIKSVVMIQHTTTLNLACALALV
jgi:hypothetical protein